MTADNPQPPQNESECCYASYLLGLHDGKTAGRKEVLEQFRAIVNGVFSSAEKSPTREQLLLNIDRLEKREWPFEEVK